jgi:uncharacterized protein (DUF488 family)
MDPKPPNPTLFTVGHSNRTFEEFLALLRAHSIGRVVDVRTVPKSRRVPWFNKEELAPALNKARIRYAYLPELGGLRHAKKDSTNLGWKNASFRGFADYMGTPEFEMGLEKLNGMFSDLNTAVMCAEAVPWRCHRSLIADAEVTRGITVEHLMSPTSRKPHELTSFAVVDKKSKPPRVSYPAYEEDKDQPALPGIPPASPKKRSRESKKLRH